MQCHSSISEFSHLQCTNLLAFMTYLPWVETLLAVMFWKWFQYCSYISLSVFMEFKIRILEGNYFSFWDVESHVRADQWDVFYFPAMISLIVFDQKLLL